MSVIQLTSAELGTFAAVAVKLKLSSLADACSACVVISQANCAAWRDRYSDTIPEVDADSVELHALNRLATNDFLGHFAPICYNCHPLPSYVAEMESACREWQDGERRRIERQAENDAAFADVGPLPLLTLGDIPPTSQRVIYAEYRVDESDSQSDYHGHRTARRVVLGFANGKREDFRQLRKCAATFEPTRHMGPGCNKYTAVVEFAHDVRPLNGEHYYRGSRSHWHDEIGNGREFTTLDELNQFLASRDPMESCWIQGVEAHCQWSFREESIENRENYSMGGGNYLGSSRHGGWVVRSTCPADAVGMEWHNSGATPPKSRKVDVDPVSVAWEKPVAEFLHTWHESGRADFAESYPNSYAAGAYDSPAHTKRAVVRRLFILLDDGTSGRFMLEKATGNVYGINGYGSVNRNRPFGTLAGLLESLRQNLRQHGERPALPVSVALPTLADYYTQNV